MIITNIETEELDPLNYKFYLNKITFRMEDIAIVTDVIFKDINTAISQVGGLSYMYMTIIIMIVKFFLYRNWERDVLRSIEPNVDSKSPAEIEELSKQVKDRVSFVGLYKLNETVENLQTSTENLDVSNQELENDIKNINEMVEKL